MTAKRACWILLLLIYGILFYLHENVEQDNSSEISYPLPSTVQKTALGYLKQIGSEVHFIKTAVFLGGVDINFLTNDHADRLSKNFDVMADLHPAFVDTYFLSQSTLPYFSAEKARENNEILKKGIAALPDNWVLPFFVGFNHFYHLQENLEASKYLLSASKLPGAATWLAHLASMLAAEGGDIYAGLIWLKAMQKGEQDETVRQSYAKDIAVFEMAVEVQKAIHNYRNQYGRYPSVLDDLVPDFLPHLPDFKGRFFLEWNPPALKLHRLKQQP
jgi:hypothetical protein